MKYVFFLIASCHCTAHFRFLFLFPLHVVDVFVFTRKPAVLWCTWVLITCAPSFCCHDVLFGTGYKRTDEAKGGRVFDHAGGAKYSGGDRAKAERGFIVGHAHRGEEPSRSCQGKIPGIYSVPLFTDIFSYVGFSRVKTKYSCLVLARNIWQNLAKSRHLVFMWFYKQDWVFILNFWSFHREVNVFFFVLFCSGVENDRN